jgi:uncharacterized protein DUF3106
VILGAAFLALALSGPPEPPAGTLLALNLQDLSPDEVDRARRNRERYHSLPEPERHKVDQNLEMWQRLTPSQRENLKQRYNENRRKRSNY